MPYNPWCCCQRLEALKELLIKKYLYLLIKKDDFKNENIKVPENHSSDIVPENHSSDKESNRKVSDSLSIEDYY